LSVLKIETAAVFEPLLKQHRYKGAYGGRGSGKSHFFADYIVERGLCMPGDAGEGLRCLAFREVQKSLKESAKFLIETKIRQHGLGEADGFKIFADRIQTPKDGLIAFTGLQDHTADSIKSYEGFHLAWGEEAHTISKSSLSLLRPTIRWEDTKRGLKSELCFSWNPRRKSDAVDEMFRGEHTPSDSVCVRANWSDNPWFPGVLDQERKDCYEKTPDQYEHIWEGGYATVTEGAYFAKNLLQAKRDGRIRQTKVEPLNQIKAFWDLGGRGSKSDATTIWIVQWIGEDIFIHDYYEAIGQPVSAHVNWMRNHGYEDALCYLPHDGEPKSPIADASWETYLRQAGFSTRIVPNQGAGAAKMRIEAARRHFHRMVFDEKNTEPGRDALGWYHEKIDEQRLVGLGPEHDWASHAADSFGMMAQMFEVPKKRKPMPELTTDWVV